MTPEEYVNSAKTPEERNFRKIEVFTLLYGRTLPLLSPDSMVEVPEKDVQQTITELLNKLKNS